MVKPEYIEAVVTAPAELRDPVIALLAEAGFSMFEESDTGVMAWVIESDFDEEVLADTLSVFSQEDVQYEVRKVESQNWNEVWEENYPSVFLDDFCQVTPSFREAEEGFTYSLVIDPKMSFGTGHHETTRLMMKQLRAHSPAGLRVLDMGSGTGILGLLAARMGATQVIGIDNDPWCFENAGENLRLNSILNMELLLGDAKDLPGRSFDLILANINRNVLLADLPAYAPCLGSGGLLFISGFYREDEPALIQAADNEGFTLQRSLSDNNWSSLAFVKR